ncbi:hypothetical protein PsorP6_003235 [Peronosclerospora sorghi]|uniref:Uncharacterized protein n=1 Tax=Peronosclerospora sorghi TaxID=230839 RepID=A0ACC0VJN7_9STRA|nr:hypothetical protein PsorP6_003235 [Peronosclerospora sorghi]
MKDQVYKRCAKRTISSSTQYTPSEIALFRCEYAVGRDTHHEDVDNMIKKLTNWKMQSAEICEINTILTLAEKEEENERKREENIRNKMAARVAGRGKSFASVGDSFRQGDDFSQYTGSGTRRGFV